MNLDIFKNRDDDIPFTDTPLNVSIYINRLNSSYRVKNQIISNFNYLESYIRELTDMIKIIDLDSTKINIKITGDIIDVNVDKYSTCIAGIDSRIDYNNNKIIKDLLVFELFKSIENLNFFKEVKKIIIPMFDHVTDSGIYIPVTKKETESLFAFTRHSGYFLNEEYLTQLELSIIEINSKNVFKFNSYWSITEIKVEGFFAKKIIECLVNYLYKLSGKYICWLDK